MILDDRATTIIPPTMMKRNPRLRGLWVRHAAVKMLISIRDKYLDEGVDIFNIFVNGNTLSLTLRGDLDVSELTPAQKKNRAQVIKMREKRKRNLTE